jgi:hypothetical protein
MAVLIGRRENNKTYKKKIEKKEFILTRTVAGGDPFVQVYFMFASAVFGDDCRARPGRIWPCTALHCISC